MREKMKLQSVRWRQPRDEKTSIFLEAIATQKGSPFIDSDMAYETKSLFSLIYSKQKTYLF